MREPQTLPEALRELARLRAELRASCSCTLRDGAVQNRCEVHARELLELTGKHDAEVRTARSSNHARELLELTGQHAAELRAARNSDPGGALRRTQEARADELAAVVRDHERDRRRLGDRMEHARVYARVLQQAASGLMAPTKIAEMVLRDLHGELGTADGMRRLGSDLDDVSDGARELGEILSRLVSEILAGAADGKGRS